MRMKKLKIAVAFVMVAAVFLAVLLATLRVSQANDSVNESKNNSREGDQMEQAILAGGCFWCMQSDFQKIPGVKEVVSGYIGGIRQKPHL